MDRLSQLRGEAGGSQDSTLDTTSPPSEAFITANESSSKFYSLSEVDSTFDISSIKEDISSIKDVSLPSTTRDSEGTITNTEELISNLSPIGKKNDIIDSYKIDTQIEAANILSGGVAIFDDNDNSYDGDELVIDDNVEVDDKSNSERKQPESLQFKTDDNIVESSLEADIASKDTEVVLQIDGKNYDAIDIGNGLYLYRNNGQEELAAVQIFHEDGPQPMFKFLKVRENSEGNLEVYEEIEIEVPGEAPVKEGKAPEKSTSSHVPIKDINKLISDSACNKISEKKAPRSEPTLKITEEVTESKKTSPDSKSEVNLNGKMMKYNESRKSPVIGSFTPMTYHSTPNKEGIPLTKTMVDQQLHPNRHSDLSNVKKTIEVLTDSSKQKSVETPTKNRDIDDNKLSDINNIQKEIVTVPENEKQLTQERNTEIVDIKATTDVFAEVVKSELRAEEKSVDDDKSLTKVSPEATKSIPMELDNVIVSTENITKEDKIGSKIILDEAKADKKMEIEGVEGKLVIKDNIQITEGILGEITQVDKDINEGKEEAMELDETDLPILEIISGVEERKEIMENKQIIIDKQEEVTKKILEDGNLNVMKEITVVKKEVKDEKNVASNKSENKLAESIKETAEAQEIIAKDDKNIQGKETVKKSPQADVSSCSVPNQTKVTKDLSATEVKSQIENKIAVSMVAQKGSISAATIEVIKKDIKPNISAEEPKIFLTEPRQVTKPVIVPEDKQKLAAPPPVVFEDTEKLKVQPVQIFEDKQKLANQPPSLLEEKQKTNSNVAEVKQQITVQPPKVPETTQKLAIKPPKLSDSTLKLTVQPPKASVTSQKLAVQPPKVLKITQNVLVQPPKVSEPLQKLEIQTAKVLVTPPKAAVQSPKVSEISQQRTVKTPKVLETTQKAAVQQLEISEIGQKMVVQPPPVSETIQNLVQLPKMSEILEKQSITAPKLYGNKQKQSVQLTTKSEDKERQGVQPSALLTDKQKQIVQHKEKQSVQLVEASDTEQNLRSQLPIVSEHKQNNNQIESLEMKDTSQEGTTKQVTAINISEPPVPSQSTQNKQIVLEKLVAEKISPSTQNVVTPTYHKIENKAVDKLVNNNSKKESMPIVSQMQVDNKVSASVAQGIEKAVLMTGIRNPEIQKNVIEMSIETTIEKAHTASDAKYPIENPNEKCKGLINVEISKVPKLDTSKVTASNQNVSSTTKVSSQNLKYKIDLKDKKEVPRTAEPKPINNNNAAVPFGKWTEANRQEFLNKFKTKTSVTSSSSNQLKNSNDLNRRDVLKKIDSQRQSSNALSKTQEANKLSTKPETAAFSNKPNIITKDATPESKILHKNEPIEGKQKTVASKNVAQIEVISKPQNEQPHKISGIAVSKNEDRCQRTGVVQNLIDKTIEGMIHRSVLGPKIQEESKQTSTKEMSLQKSAKPEQTYQPIEQATLDAIEMKMNELHGIPFIERPPHELPQVHKPELKSYSKIDKEKIPVPSKSKVPNLLPFPNKIQQKVTREGVIEVDSEDEIIEHEPITGDIDLDKKNQVAKPPAKEKSFYNTTPQVPQETIITEKDFDKFARRNSITYENCLTVNFDGKEPHNVVQTVMEKDTNPKSKSYSRNDTGCIDPKAKLPLKYQNVRLNEPQAKPQLINKFGPANDDGSNRNQSKLQKAYQSALTAKRQMTTECPITIIEDKPVKVVFMDSVDYVPSQLNVQGQDLSPAKRPIPESDVTVSTCDSLDSDIMDSTDETKSQDEVKTKTKHQRKQVLTPVEEPELELIEPCDLGLEISPKKKRKTEDDKIDKNMKYPMRKKMYLLSSSAVTEDKATNPVDLLKKSQDTANINDNSATQKNPVSALDSLVKAAELIETQTENISTTSIMSTNSESNPSTPVKRGRGRPRKYPLTPEGTVDKSKVISAPSPQKKPRLIDAKTPKRDTFTDDSDTDDEIIKENWTMGKINENIVCPICNKLFRTENVVFKHVKHCTGPSPSRSDSDKRSPRRMRISQDFDTKSCESKSDDMDTEDDKPLITRKETPKKRKSKDSVTKSDDKDDVIVIEDTPIKVNPEKSDERKNYPSRKSRTKIPHKSNDLVCEFCGKTFRQLSYLVSHRLQHKKAENDKPEPKKIEKDPPVPNKSVYSCEVCKKEFRKLHHLVQHRIIHNPSTAPIRSSRKGSSEHTENKIEKEPNTSKQSDDPGAGFRCEPCDKSFRKLHHLVEHRETHDGINRQKTTAAQPIKEEKAVEKPATLHQCDVCKKTFRKLQHLNEHKEQHMETSSEKSDDKSVKSSLSTKDIIHECSLCYMVFPNEHSLNKHTIICQRKKRQCKQKKPTDENEDGDEVTESPPLEEKSEPLESPITLLEDSKQVEDNQEIINESELTKEKPVITDTEATKEKSIQPVKIAVKEKIIQKQEPIATEQVPPAKRDIMEIETAKTETISATPKKFEVDGISKEHKVPKTHESLKREKKTPVKAKIATKRLKTAAVSTSVGEEVKPARESSDDDEVRYMLNPNFKGEQVTEEKVFMKVRAKKRSSLQIERPNSKDLVKRRTSLQHPPKIPRLKPKALEATPNVKKESRIPKIEPVPSTDSDDSETTKYSFPSTIPEKPIKPAQVRTPKDSERKILKKSLVDKRKLLSGIAKKKSLGNIVTARHKVSPLKQVKKRTLDAEHRCDCGQLFSSAALLSRHTTLAHTPPRIRRRRSPPPEEKPVIKPPPRKSSAAEKTKQTPASRKSSVRSDSSTSNNAKSMKNEAKGRKSVVKDLASPSERKTKSKNDKTVSTVSDAKSSSKPRRPTAHRGVPVPEKMRKVMQKNK